MNDTDGLPASGGLAGRPAAAPPGAAGDRVDESGRDEATLLTGDLTVLLDPDLPDDDTPAKPSVLAEWALWGKEAGESAYHVLRCSKGRFVPDDFREIITRYAPGAKEDLPQYTVCWIPDEMGDPEYVAVGIHELASADPRQSGGRSRHDANGRPIEFVRLFCVRYAELAKHAVGYQELAEAVGGLQLPPGSVDPVTVMLSAQSLPRPAAGPVREQAESVAALLLTTRPVCVLGAERVSAADRLEFIDTVMALLPYGLRTTMSASTWASSTAQDLKLRLFFANAERDDGGHTSCVMWGRLAELHVSVEAAVLYMHWLKDAGARAPDLLAGQTEPVRFNAADIRRMVGKLPKDKPVAETLEELARSLRRGDVAGVQSAVIRLRRHLVARPQLADCYEYRRLIAWHGLLKDHPELHPSTRASVYRVLLRLAFTVPLSYDSYCEIEDCLGAPPRGLLLGVMIKFEFTDYLAWVLSHMAADRPNEERLMESLWQQGVPATAPLNQVDRQASGRLRPAHGKTVLDFSVRYLRVYSEDAQAELIERGYLAQLLEIIFQDKPAEQRRRLQDTLRFIYRGMLKRGQITEIFDQPGLYPTDALVAAVTRMAAQRKAAAYISERAYIARLRYAGFADEAATVQRSRQPRPIVLSGNAFRSVPRRAVYAGVVVVAAIAGVLSYLLVSLLSHG